MVKLNSGKADKLIFISFLWSIIFYSSVLSEQYLLPGIYRNNTAFIGIDGNFLTGLIDAKIGEAGTYVCQFYFFGSIDGNKFPVYCINFIDTGKIEGYVNILDNSIFILKTKENPGCSNMIASFEDNGDTLTLDSIINILQIRIVNSEKAFFHEQPNISTKKRSYLIQGDEVTVYDKRKDWLYTIYNNISGWLYEKDMIQF